MKNSCSFSSVADDFSGVAQKISKYGVCSGSYFPIFELNTEIYWVVNLRIQPIYGNI